MPATTALNTEELAALARRHRVCYEVWPEYIMVRGERRQIGFTLELSGTLESDGDYPYPQWVGCQRAFAALHRIAEAILPQEKRPSLYDIGPYDQALHYSRLRGNRPDVTVPIRILHRHGFERPVDACEIRCLEEMQQRLRELGACEGQWTSGKEDQL